MNTGESYQEFHRHYSRDSLRKADVQGHPIEQFKAWFFDAVEEKVPDLNAMSLGTSVNGQPSVRIVLLKGFDESGFVFYTNYSSRKGQELAANPKASLSFYWHSLERQVRIEGLISKVSEEESDEYFNSRDRGSKIGAWASPQSRVVSGRNTLEEGVESFFQKFEGQEDIPRPEHWGGYRLVPHFMEFWQGRDNRLHDRIVYTESAEGLWKIERLAP